MEDLFFKLSLAVEGTALVAISASVLWGIMSVLLSPCHLGSIPLIVGFISGQRDLTTKRAFVLSSVFSVGILITIALIGALTALLGRMIGDIGPAANWILIAVFFVVGLLLMDVIPQFGGGLKNISIKRKGLFPALLLGILFGVALGPCTFAFMAPMLAVTFKVGTTNMMYGAVLLAAFGIGHCGVIALAGTFTEVVQRYLNWTQESKGQLIFRKICGGLVILAGVYMLYKTI